MSKTATIQANEGQVTTSIRSNAVQADSVGTNKSPTSGAGLNTAKNCSCCGEDRKARRRNFSEQAWTALLLWSEVEQTAIDQPICDGCYGELRETLIDRAEEVNAVAVGGNEGLIRQAS